MRKNGIQMCTLFNMTLITVCSWHVAIDSFCWDSMPVQVNTKFLVCATHGKMWRTSPYVYDNLQQTAGQADAHYCTADHCCQPTLKLASSMPERFTNWINLVHLLEVDPVEVTLVFLKLTLAMTTFPSPLVAQWRHLFLPSLVSGYEPLPTTTHVGWELCLLLGRHILASESEMDYRLFEPMGQMMGYTSWNAIFTHYVF